MTWRQPAPAPLSAALARSEFAMHRARAAAAAAAAAATAAAGVVTAHAAPLPAEAAAAAPEPRPPWTAAAPAMLRRASHAPPAPAPAPDMVPITATLLRERYARFPDPALAPALAEHRAAVAAMHARLMRDVPPAAVVHAGENAGQSSHEVVRAILAEKLPAGLDNSMYTARCACEEAADRCRRVPELRALAPRFVDTAAKYETFQQKQSEHVSSVINGFLPQDFRGHLFTAYRQKSERTNQQALQELMDAGGSVRDKYALMWEQQWKRRESLAMIGNASGVWRWLVRYLAGVPQPLLTFAKNINSPDGPTEALRAKFGGALSDLSRFAIELNALASAAAFTERTKITADVKEQLEKSLTLYQEEVDKFVELLQRVIVDSPFFIRPEEIASIKPKE